MTDPNKSSSETVRAILHIASLAAWEAAQRLGRYEAESLRAEGFIHCSQSHQVIEVLNRLFRGRVDLLLLVIDPARLTHELRFEQAENGQEYPHVYGPIDLAAVVSTRAIAPNPQGLFPPTVLTNH